MAEKKAGAEKPAEPQMSAGAGSAKDKDSNLLAALAYVTSAGLVIPVVLYLVKKEDRFVRFHSLQATLLWIATWFVFGVLQVVTMITGMLGPLAVLGCVFGLISVLLLLGVGVVSLYCAYKVFNGEDYEIPHFGPMARKYAG